jgi:hypothetical protein
LKIYKYSYLEKQETKKDSEKSLNSTTAKTQITKAVVIQIYSEVYFSLPTEDYIT